MASLDLPPLLRGEEADAPFTDAVTAGRAGADPGLILYAPRPDRLDAALLLAPEVTLQDAAPMLLLAANAFADAFGALAPSEVGAHFDWPGGLRVNGGSCGGLRWAASTADPLEIPDWMAIGLEAAFFEDARDEPGLTPGRTTLHEEGCGDITPRALLEMWARRMLARIHDWGGNGLARDHADWLARRWAPEGETPRVLGLDERGGLLLEGGALRPLTDCLETV